MGDFKLVQDSTTEDYDIDFQGIDFVIEDGLQPAVIASLFSDRRITVDEQIDLDASRRGWWADTFRDILLGSKFWLVARRKEQKSLIDDVESFATEALKWMIDEGVAAEIIATATFPARGFLELSIDIFRPNGEKINFRFDENWGAEIAATT